MENDRILVTDSYGLKRCEIILSPMGAMLFDYDSREKINFAYSERGAKELVKYLEFVIRNYD
jgi:hypothetical protein